MIEELNSIKQKASATDGSKKKGKKGKKTSKKWLKSISGELTTLWITGTAQWRGSAAICDLSASVGSRRNAIGRVERLNSLSLL